MRKLFSEKLTLTDEVEEEAIYMLDCPVTSILVTNTVIDITQQRACDIPTPRNVSEALAEKHAAQWLKSMAIDWACYTVNRDGRAVRMS